MTAVIALTAEEVAKHNTAADCWWAARLVALLLCLLLGAGGREPCLLGAVPPGAEPPGLVLSNSLAPAPDKRVRCMCRLSARALRSPPPTVPFHASRYINGNSVYDVTQFMADDLHPGEAAGTAGRHESGGGACRCVCSNCCAARQSSQLAECHVSCAFSGARRRQACRRCHL